MEVILLENIKKLGKIGSKVKVANGFARNYLLKNNKALVASKENLAIFEKRKEELNKKNNDLKNDAVKIQKEIDKLISTNKKAQKTIQKMHKDDKRTFNDAMSREFRAYSLNMRKLLEKKYKDEETKLNNLRNEFRKLFKVDVWDEVLWNPEYEFDTVEEFFDCVKLYVRKNYA